MGDCNCLKQFYSLFLQVFRASPEGILYTLLDNCALWFFKSQMVSPNLVTGLIHQTWLWIIFESFQKLNPLSKKEIYATPQACKRRDCQSWSSRDRFQNCSGQEKCHCWPHKWPLYILKFWCLSLKIHHVLLESEFIPTHSVQTVSRFAMQKELTQIKEFKLRIPDQPWHLHQWEPWQMHMKTWVAHMGVLPAGHLQEAHGVK